MLVILALFALAGRVSAQAPITPSDLDAVEKIFAQAAAKAPEGGMTAGVVSGKDLVLTRSYGFADIRAHTPATADTVYRIGYTPPSGQSLSLDGTTAIFEAPGTP